MHPAQYFFYQSIVFLAPELKRGKLKKKMLSEHYLDCVTTENVKNSHFAVHRIEMPVFLIPNVDFNPSTHPILLAKLHS